MMDAKMFFVFSTLAATVWTCVELFKYVYDSASHKVNKDVIVALGLGLLVSFALPLDIYAPQGIVFMKLKWVGELLTGLMLGGFGAKLINDVPGYLKSVFSKSA
jgi:hypothetical protein